MVSKYMSLNLFEEWEKGIDLADIPSQVKKQVTGYKHYDKNILQPLMIGKCL